MDFSRCFEMDVFEKVRYYLKEQEWEDAYINRIILDSGDVEFNVFLKNRGQTFMKTFDRADFEDLVMAAYNNMFKVMEKWTRMSKWESNFWILML